MVLKHMKSFVALGKTPAKADCEECIAKAQGSLDRSWKEVKYFIYNHNSKQRKRRRNNLE